ncbi:MAG: phosphoglycerate dehydrogenase [Pseudobdellovibrionaceae bacterium]
MPKVLISDKMDPLAKEIFEKRGVEVDVKTGLSEEELIKIIGEYDGLAVRSSTTATPALLVAAKNMKVIGRAGIGVDNIDLKEATKHGIIVMNTPFGNSITTAEHAIAMMFALARDIPQASASTHAGKWEKSKFMGVELYSKTLGVIGCGNIGSIVINRAQGLKMNVIGYDPFLTDERAKEMGIEKVELDEIYARSDFITLHVPKNDKTKDMINKAAIAKMKDGVRIINCARGGLIVEEDLKEALDSGKVAGAALDVFAVEPAKENALFGHEKLICTPHLGASTTEAQVNVAIQVAEQMSDYLLTGAITNAINTASITAEEAPKLKPYMALASQIGAFAGQITEHAISKVEITYLGKVASLNVKPLTSTILAELLGQFSDSVNMVNAAEVAKGKGITVSETKQEDSDDFSTAIRVVVETEKRSRSVTGTLFGKGAPRIVEIEGVPVEAALTGDMLFIRNQDKPGLIGGVGTILGEAGHNIADFRLGRTPDGAHAVALLSLDKPIPDDLFAKVDALPQVDDAIRLHFAA